MILDHSPFLDSKISTLPEHVVYYNDDPYLVGYQKHNVD